MPSLSTIASDIATYDGYHLQAYLLENIDLIGYCASFYLVMVGKGSTILSWFYKEKMHAKTEKELARQLSHLYGFSFLVHATMAAVSIGSIAVLGPKLLASINETGFYRTACIWNDSLVYLGAAGVALSVLTLSKIAEFLTTVSYTIRDFLLNRNTAVPVDALRAVLVQTHNTINPPHWWYYTLVSLYFWHTFSVGVSTFPLIACVNGALRGASNAAMAIEDASMRSKLASFSSSAGIAAHKTAAKRSAIMKALGVVPIVNMLVECVVCSAIAVYSSYQNYTAAQGCSTMQANVRMCVLMYLSALALAFYQLRDMRRTKKQVAPDANKKRQ